MHGIVRNNYLNKSIDRKIPWIRVIGKKRVSWKNIAHWQLQTAIMIPTGKTINRKTRDKA